MQLAAFVPPLWAATPRALQELTRLAVTALVLVVGAGGVAATPAATTALRPTVVTSRVAELRPEAAAAELAYDSPTDRAVDAPAARPDRLESAPRPATAYAVALADPGRDAVGRRGPPQA